MGGGTWSDDAYKHISSGHSKKSAKDIFSSTTDKDMSPKGVDIRESRDSDEHPETTPIIVALDVTGSMGHIPEELVKHKLGALMDTLLRHGITDPQIMFMAIGDQEHDRAPLQVSQFESATELIDKWLTKIFIESGGGGTGEESYELAWLFASRHTSIDCFEKRGKKGFIFTIGDEMTWNRLSSTEIAEIFGDTAEDVTDERLLEEARRMYNVFHIHVLEGSNGKDTQTIEFWKNLMGQHVIMLEDHNVIAEVIASTVALVKGTQMKKIAASFDKKTADAVSKALAVVDTTASVDRSDNGVVKI